jgi:oligopeptide/dipeptide ABC transporter ATP-binding protein
VTDAEPPLSVTDLRTHFHTDAGVVKAVDGVSFSVGAGEVLAVVGESGSGKSVTGLSILGLLPKPSARIESGRIMWRGTDLVGLPEDRLRRIRGAEISMIFQDPMTSLNPVFTIGKQIIEMIRVHDGVSRRAARARAIDMLGAVGIPRPAERVDMYPHEFSGGMRQRAMIAMAISCGPQLIIADEPTTALDVTVQAQVLEVLESIQERTGAAMILITHDLGVVAGVADRIVVMYAGRVVETGTVDEIFYRPRHPYTLGLMASLPRADSAGEQGRLRPIGGQPPSLLRVPEGCSFHPRCDFAELPEPCASQDPLLRAIDGDHCSACHFAERLADVSIEQLRVEA